jgi:hypothetical protein
MLGKLLASVIWRMVPPRRPPDFLIGPDENNPYMRRWWIIPRNRWFNIYLHHMLHDDDDRAPHDHPWWSLSLCLHGRIREMVYILGTSPQEFKECNIEKGDWRWRGTTFAHFLKLPDGEAWTLFITGPNVRTWGFHCPKGWLEWKKFVNAEKPGQPGRGCGELS